MDIKQLNSLGGFVSQVPKKVSKTWTHNNEDFDIEFFVIKQSFGQVERIYLSNNSDNTTRSRASELISEFIRLGKDGSERLTYEQAYSLEPSLAGVFMEAINENLLEKKAETKRVKRSGTSS